MTTRLRQQWKNAAMMKTIMMMVMMMMMMLMMTTVEGASVEAKKRRKRSEDTGSEWSVWFNSDLPTEGEGDFETTDSIGKHHQICSGDREVAGAECRVSGSNDTFDSSTTAFLDDRLLQACSSHGLICLNAEQASRQCHDYQVRFLCQDPVDSDNNSLFPNLDFKIYILLAAVPLLVIALRLLWSCCCKQRIKRQRQQQRRQGGGGQRHRDSLGSDTLSTSSSQASIDSALAHPPPAYTELFGDNPPPRSAVFSISGGECAGCGKCLHSPYVVEQGGIVVNFSSPVGEGQTGPAPVSPPLTGMSECDDVFVTPTSQGSEAAVTSQSVARSVEPSLPSSTSIQGAEMSQNASRGVGSGLRPSLPSSSSLQGAVALPLSPQPPVPSSHPTCAHCTCACHRVTSGHVNLAFHWDCGDQGAGPSPAAPPPPPLHPGMHKPVFSFPRMGSVTSFTSLPDYEEALEILKKSGLFREEEKV